MNEKQPVDIAGQTGVHLSIADNAKSLHLSRAEERVIMAMREVGKRGKSWILILMGNSAGVRIHETLPPRWEPK